MGAKQLVGGALVGAGLVYLLDPEQGAMRRAAVGQRLGLSQPGGHYGLRLGDIAGLEAANIEPAADTGRTARVAGGVLLAYGVIRRGRAGRAIRALGLGLVARGLRRRPAALVPGDRRRTIDIQKTVHVEARPERVFAFWSEYDNLPAILPNLREVRDLGHGRSRWVVTGPDERPVAWTAVLTEREPPRLLAWRSEEGAVLDHAGVVRFTPEGTGTRIDFRFCYSPPAGREGRALAEFFGADPRARVNEDFGRLKTLLESTPQERVP
jgi:uncharacterized membrane protein